MFCNSCFILQMFCSVYCVFSTLLCRKIKMVDIVTQTMPAESEVHVARNFLTKILRSSMRYCGAVDLCLVNLSPVVITHQPLRPCQTQVSHPLPCGVLAVAVLFTCKNGIIRLSLLSFCQFHWLLWNLWASSVFPAVLLMTADHFVKNEQMFCLHFLHNLSFIPSFSTSRAFQEKSLHRVRFVKLYSAKGKKDIIWSS